MLPVALFALALLLSVHRSALGQHVGDGALAPVLAGSIEVGLHEGLIAAALCLRPVPSQGDTVRFVLHRGMNVKRIHDGAGRELRLLSAPAMQTDADEMLYTVLDSAVGEASDRRSLCVEYRGAFPVYDVAHADYRSSDGSDVIAFNGQTLRARGESRWYPAPYDPLTRAAVGALAFDLRIRCAACQRLYVNGSTREVGPEAELRSTAAVEPFLFVGTYPDTERAGMRILGEAVAVDTATSFAARIGEITRYYEQVLGVPWGPQVVVVRVVPVRRDRRGQLWGFLADPALGLAGLTIGDFVQILADTVGPARPLALGVLAHELAHRFFPWRMRPTADEFQFFSEPFAVYLDLQATRHFLGDSAYGVRLAGLRRRLTESDSLPLLTRATPKDLAADSYRYAYAPLLLVALERQIGEAPMRALLRALLTSGPAAKRLSPLARLREAARQAHVPAARWEKWQTQCVDVRASRAACLR